MVEKGDSKIDKTNRRLSKIVTLVSSVTVLVGATTGVFSWVSGQFTNAISSQIDEFRQEVKKSDQGQNQAITRLELMNLIQNDPTNVLAIEKMAKYYFSELGGNQYMTKMFSDWAREYGGDPSIVVGEK